MAEDLVINICEVVEDGEKLFKATCNRYPDVADYAYTPYDVIDLINATIEGLDNFELSGQK